MLTICNANCYCSYTEILSFFPFWLIFRFFRQFFEVLRQFLENLECSFINYLTQLWKKCLPFAMQTANADAESNCSSSGIIRLLCKLCWSREFFWAREFLSECKLLCCWLWWWWLRPLGGATIELDADPVEVVSEMEEPELKGGKDRSDGDGEDGATADCKHKMREFD